ncbi:MAG: HAMP domain-containing histidine kinase, partial [Candidatus Aminicenantes bacterium]|nr:HAMP domain-containing histidine kinase [Candidatus Aminicenantes bacterium]
DARLALEKISAPGTRIVGLQDPGGLPLSPALANARLLLPASPAGGPSASSPDSRSSLYLLIVALALGIMTFGSYLFWRDVRRDLETAEMRSQFVASVSHELKTPLAAIRMFADTLRLGRLRDPEKREEYLETIANESQRLDRLLSNVLDVAKIEKGQRVYRFEKTSLRGVIETAVRAMDYPLRQKGFELRLNLVDGIPDLSADRDALVQAVLNLLDNAVKYSGEARLIDIVLEREGAAAVIRVVDRGIGVPEAERKRIFEKFYRAPDPRNEGVVGAGLGLALAAHIVEAHRGRIEVRSRPGEETVFSIHLPLENGG